MGWYLALIPFSLWLITPSHAWAETSSLKQRACFVQDRLHSSFPANERRLVIAAPPPKRNTDLTVIVVNCTHLLLKRLQIADGPSDFWSKNLADQAHERDIEGESDRYIVLDFNDTRDLHRISCSIGIRAELKSADRTEVVVRRNFDVCKANSLQIMHLPDNISETEPGSFGPSPVGVPAVSDTKSDPSGEY